jgi:PAS domain S-box-containing protein
MTQLLAPLPPDPPSVAEARRLVASALSEADCAHVIDTVLLLTSEVVTNAVLHAGTELELRVEVDDHIVHVEVLDRSPVLPAPRDYGEEASTGRGLGLVAMLACDHGAERRGAGKAVWFEVRTDDAAAPPELDPEALLEAWDVDDAPLPRPHRATAIRLLGVPVHLFRAMRQHDDALLREHALMRSASGHVPTRPALDLGTVDDAVRDAAEGGFSLVDVTLHAPEDAATSARAVLDLLAEADQHAASGRMLTPAALPEVRSCRVWHLEEIAGQTRGATPRAWSPVDVGHREESAELHIDPMVVLQAVGHAVVVGDEENRIVFANDGVEELLGWAPEALIGKRITVLVPDRLRERHIAGYTRMLVGQSKPRLLDRAVRVPARRRDGSEVDVELRITRVAGRDGRPAFVASLQTAAD